MHAALHLHVTGSQQKPFDHKSIPKFLRSYKKGTWLKARATELASGKNTSSLSRLDNIMMELQAYLCGR